MNVECLTHGTNTAVKLFLMVIAMMHTTSTTGGMLVNLRTKYDIIPSLPAMLNSPRTGEKYQINSCDVMKKEYAQKEENSSITNKRKKDWRDCIPI